MAQRSLSILLIDDHPASRDFLGTRLAALGTAVHLAGDVREGIAALSGQCFDLILSKLSGSGQGEMLITRFAHRFSSGGTTVNLQPKPGSIASFDLSLATPAEIYYFFTSLRYLAGPSRGAPCDHLAGGPS